MSPPDHTDRLYGIHPVLEALRSKQRGFEQIYLQQGRRGREVDEILAMARAGRIPVVFKPRAFLDQMIASRHHQGAVGLVAAKPYLELDELLDSIAGRTDPLLLLLDGIEDPHNLGAVLRTAEAAGASGIVLPERRAIGLTATVAKASAGAVEHLPVAKVVNLSQAIERLKLAKFWIYALDAGACRSYLEVDYRGPVALVIGGEGRGIRALVAEHCDERVSIPMHGKVSSLNVSVATAIALFEILRQRSGGGSVRRGGIE